MNLDSIEKYYTQKIKEHGVTSKGVDWKDSDSHELRFYQLLRSFKITPNESIFDFGCGYGALLSYLSKEINVGFYYGYDISQAMLDEASKLFSTNEKILWSTYFPIDKTFDYSFLSGIFNVRNDISDDNWKNYIIETLDRISKITSKGFSFNILTRYSDQEFQSRSFEVPQLP